jgi:hypothetical protein
MRDNLFHAKRPDNTLSTYCDRAIFGRKISEENYPPITCPACIENLGKETKQHANDVHDQPIEDTATSPRTSGKVGNPKGNGRKKTGRKRKPKSPVK